MNTDALLAILGMAVVTYGIRAGGLMLATRIPSTGFIAAWLRHVPGAVMAALVAPAVLEGGPAEWGAATATALIYVGTRNLFAAMAGGVAVVWLLRQWLGA